MNYTGGKYKLLPQILPFIPKCNNFVDLFCGGLDMVINVSAERKYANDITQIIDLYKYLQKEDNVLEKINEVINKYKLSKENDEGFYLLRAEYNKSREPLLLLLLCFYSFNNCIRFNSKGEFNKSFGKGRSGFNPALQSRLGDFLAAIKEIEFTKKDFREYDLSWLSKDDFVYVDPPYLITNADYNAGWGEEEEKDLYKLLDNLSAREIKWGMSNVLENNSKSNDLLKNWAKNIKYLNYDYNNSSPVRKNNGKTIEVYIHN